MLKTKSLLIGNLILLSSILMAGNVDSKSMSDLNPVTIKKTINHSPVPIFLNGVPKATICLMDEVQNQKTLKAVTELQTCMELIGGEKLAISKGKLVDGPTIVIGNCKEAKEIGLDGSKMPIEGFAIKTTQNRIYIVGHDDKEIGSYGTAWGIYEFLEREANVRWYWTEQNGGRYTKKQPNLTVAPIWLEDAPVYRKRDIWPSHLPGLAQLHMALRSANSWPINLIVHAPHNLGKIENFSTTRPEIFQLHKDGKRDSIMLCYGNKRTLETYLERIAEHFDNGKKLERGDIGIDRDTITVSPWDNNISCYCEDCQKLLDKNGGAYGSASPILENFVAKLGEEVKKRWPGKTVLYLPYMNYTLASGTVKFPDNVEVQLCGMPGVALYKESIVNKQFQGNIDKWQKLTGRKVQTWDYSCWPEDRTKAPYHYPHVLKKYYQDNQDKIVGSFINGVTDHWPRSNWSLYCWMKCLWNPEFNVDAAAEEFCKRMFGPASAPMQKLLNLQISCWEDSRFSNGTLSATAVYTQAFPAPVIKQMKSLLKDAHRLGDSDPVIKQRLDYYETPFADFFKEYEYVVEGKGMTPLVLKKTGEMPVIDGKLDDKMWETAPKASFHFYDSKQKKQASSKFPTTMQALWNENGIIYGFYMKEPNPKALKKDNKNSDDGALYWQDCIELFIDPSGTNSADPYHLIITAGDAVFDSFGKDTTWTCDGLKFKSYEGNDYWSMEVFIPHKALGANITTSSTGQKWHGQFCRHRMSDLEGGRENQKLNANQPGFNSNTGDFTELRFME